ncbi:hypothetical protein [Melittangium boletus]|uniref:Uncharacterized protein n=1 Tax=Melittangium boletus DSM 14713 TaxID=1294270 RepID=A0A250IBP2_9BACT|nr:hypothetical protein [Melittangium boletus]ATB28630.1 hypothetical protein MEBOL_002079 [Melittangium boletus DSM 14713]
MNPPHLRAAKTRWIVLLTMSLELLGCADANPNVRARRLPDGHIQVDGPLAGPYDSLEELAERSCDLMTGQPGATHGAHGFEYCALFYRSAEEGSYYLSYLSDIRGNLDPVVKTCSLPTRLNDPAHAKTLLLGGAHTHPNSRGFSPRDLSAASHWRPVRFFDTETGKVWDHQLMVFFREKTGECRTYIYNNSTRIVSALRQGKWIPIGEVYDDLGYIRMYEGKDWLP